MNVIPLTERQEQALEVIATHRNSLLIGGSRSGKTFLLCYAVVCRALYCRSRHAILRFHFNDVKRSIGMDTLPKILAQMKVRYVLNKSDWVFILHNKSEIWLGGLDDKERVDKVLGNEYATIYLNEASQISYHAYTTAQTRLALRTKLANKVFIDCNPPEKSHFLYSLFVLQQQPGSGDPLFDADSYGMIRMNPADNPYLPPEYVTSILAGLPERQKQRFLYGEWLDKRVGSLWSRDLIDSCRTDTMPAYFSQKIIAIDPAVSSREDADETGIIEAGVDYDGGIYILKDISGRYSPSQWADLVMDTYAADDCDMIVAEVNQGGDLVESNLKAAARIREMSYRYTSVRATRGKVLRAEPVEALYEKKKVHHVGYFPELEGQMTEWVPTDRYSPDRLDALVWAVTYLLEQGGPGGEQPIEPTVPREGQWL
ncbi:MAG TPA: phage terminase large subunit [Methanocorpusculum sp.]|nr:phage terminase large subunit [Methanocorpusculum sp.]